MKTSDSSPMRSACLHDMALYEPVRYSQADGDILSVDDMNLLMNEISQLRIITERKRMCGYCHVLRERAVASREVVTNITRSHSS
jgi:hypothetical protein